MFGGRFDSFSFDFNRVAVVVIVDDFFIESAAIESIACVSARGFSSIVPNVLLSERIESSTSSSISLLSENW